ncbi:Proline-rich protein [Desulfovibrio sp. DV]|uniref:hypothetical protein n=1 Tax=Desulfovibrio sp. DV TaxID=1844708 RepID=UPI00094BAFDB|nr:hypothetical protein [Desulfovibrio sp. DV]OLN24383.1 Proline-rich protein [Desulfovibrio sp. DV]
MSAIRLFAAAVAILICVAAADPGLPGDAMAGTPAPLPTTLTIRDASQPPTPSTPARPFVSRPAKRKPRRAKPQRRQPVPPKAQAPTPTDRNPAAPRLEQRYQTPTESIFPLDPEPAKAASPPQASGKTPEPKAAPAAFPPEPAPAPAPAAK